MSQKLHYLTAPDGVTLHPLLQNNFLNILEANHDGILIIDHKTNAVFVNSKYVEITGNAPEELLGKPLRVTRPHAMVSDIVRTGKTMAGIYRKEGDIEYLADLAPIISAGKVVGAISICKDITEVQRLTKELRQSRSSTRNLLSSLRHLYKARYRFDDILGDSDTFSETVRRARSLAAIDADILITGESGTGKELFAQAIHNASSRSQGPFIAFNCASLAPSVMESELFGYVDGAFTGARRGGKEGFFSVAEEGTLLLDEISELSHEGQGKLLRVLQERAVRPVGHTVESPIDVRIMAATNKDLRTLMSEGKFREDLFYRLNVLHLDIPPLRARGEDPLLLAKYFGRRIAGRYVPISEKAAEAIAAYPWPGNIRELYNAVQYALYMTNGERILYEHLPRVSQEKARKPAGAGQHPTASIPGFRTLAEITAEAEQQAISGMLAHFGAGVKAKKNIARILNISLTTLYNKIKH